MESRVNNRGGSSMLRLGRKLEVKNGLDDVYVVVSGGILQQCGVFVRELCLGLEWELRENVLLKVVEMDVLEGLLENLVWSEKDWWQR
jgi:hypothetical protein